MTIAIARCLSVLTLAAALACAPAARAQTAAPVALPAAPASPAAGGHHHHRRGNSFTRALRTLDLSAAQKQQIAGFRAQQRAADGAADPATKRANAAKMRTAVMGILTPEQKAQLSSAMHHSRAPRGSAAPQPDAEATP